MKQETYEQSVKWLNEKFNGRGIEVQVINWNTDEITCYNPSKLLNEYAEWKKEISYTKEDFFNDVFPKEKPKQYDIGIDTFQRAEANMTKEEIIASCKFNIDKYCWRKKGQDKEDFEKIINYAKFALKQFKDE